MNKFDLKKYTIFLFVCFFSLICSVCAKNYTPDPITLYYGSSYSIGAGFVGFQCPDGELGVFDITYNDANSTYTVQQNRIADSAGSEELVCYYDYESGASTQESGSVKYTFNYKKGEEISLEVFLTITEPSEDVIALLNASKIVSWNQIEDGNEYLDVTCNETSCKAEMSQMAKDLAGDNQNYLSIVEFTYLPSGSTTESKATIKFNINVFQGAYAWVNHTDSNSIAQCSFGGSWKPGSDVKSNGHTVYYYSTSDLTNKLPDCTANPKAAVPVEYKGWIEVEGEYVYAVSNSCSTAKSGSSITLQPNGHYAPCFEYKPFVRLVLPSGDLESTTGWTTGDSSHTYLATSSNASDTITLPNVVFEGFSSGNTFEYWIDNETGQKYNPGDVVPYNSHTYTAQISTTTNYGNEYKVVNVGKSVFLNTLGLKSCTVDTTGSSYVSASMSNGECLVYGNVLTPTDVYADVLVTLEDGSIKTYKFSVTEDTSLDAASNGEFIINLNPPSGGGSGGSSELDDEPVYVDATTGAATNECMYFTIKSSGTRGEIGYSKLTTKPHLTSTVYSVSTPKCDSDTNQYVALCLDPGRLGPSNNEYQRGEDIQPNTEMGKLVTYFATNLDISSFGDPYNESRIAAHMAARIVGVANGFNATTSDDTYYANLYEPYRIMGEYFDANPNASATELEAKLDDCVTFSSSSLKSLVAKYISEAMAMPEQAEGSDDYFGFEITGMDAAVSAAYGTTGYTITYTGTIKAPEGVTSFTLKETDEQDANGAAFGVSFNGGSTTCDGGDADGRISCDYEITITAPKTADVKAPSDDEKPLLSFEIEYEGGEMANSIFIATPINTSKTLQRMLIFNLGKPSILVYFDILPNSCELPGMDYTVCADPSSSACQNDFASKLFVAAGCCAEVTDEVTYSYVANNICNGECTTSTLPQVCSYDASNLGQTDLYEIRDGAFISGGTLSDNISECVVNTKDIYEKGNASTESLFDRFDDAGNELNVSEFSDNEYCEVTCKEDWQITMDSFGNYAGEKAVAAGHYFQIVNNDIFMSAKRTCYTNYVDYEHYANDLVQDGKTFVNYYNDYSNKSHAYSDYEKQTDESNWNFSWSSVTTYDRAGSCTRHKGCTPNTDSNGNPTGTCSPYNFVTCSQSSADATKDYWAYELDIQSTNSEFEDTEAGKGKYIKFYVEEDTEVDYSGRTSGNDYTELLIKDGEEGAKPTLYTDDGLSKTNSLTVCYNPGDQPCTPGDSDGSSCPWSCSDSGSGYKETTAGSDATSTHQAAFSEMKTERMNTLNSEMNTLKGSMTALRTKIDDRVKDMYDCQHFQLDNTSDGTSGEFYDGGPTYDFTSHATTQQLSGTLYYNGGSKDTIKIETMFQPYVEYKYAEDAYMTILIGNKENYLEQFDDKNDKEYGSDWAAATNDKKEIEININGSTEKVDLARNYMDFNYYAVEYGDSNYTNLWQPDSDVGRKYGADGTATGLNKPKDGVFGLSQGTQGTTDDSDKDGQRLYKLITICSVNGVYDSDANAGTSDTQGPLEAVTTGPTWTGGSCYEFKAPYIAANYISASIENSSFYKNQGTWYGSVEDLKEHGETLDDAIQNAISVRSNMYNYNKQNELKSGKWSPIGLFNVFPISITTPRNLYTYTYEFYDVGSYYDGDLGRIMGGENHDTSKAIIEENSRTCFYEVFEELCLCCGDKINTYVYDDSLTQSMISQFVTSSGVGYQQSDINKIETNKGGTLSVATSSVNLSNMSSVSGRDVAANWSDNSSFTYGGDIDLNTGKGAELMTYIESQGESIYSKTSTDNGPEYSYYLTPTTLSSIREYNQTYGYGINYDTLIGYGRYSIASQDGGYTEDNFKEKNTGDFNDKIINFQHYGSKFLEELTYIDGAVLSGTLATPNNTNVCFVLEGDVDSIESKMSGTNPCRWVDYIEDLSDNSSGNTSYTYPANSDAGSGTVRYFRLAFK